MPDIFSQILSVSYAGVSPVSNMAAVTCTLNGRAVDCPTWFVPVFAGSWMIILGLSLLIIVATWKVFAKAGKPGWTSIVPIYNIVVLLEITKKPLWWILLCFVPFVNIVISFMIAHELSKVFGRGLGFGIGLFLLPMIFYPILGFGKTQYMHAQTPAQPVI